MSNTWPDKRTEEGRDILPDPISYNEILSVACNAPYKVNGEIVGYCEVIVPWRDKRRWFRKTPAYTHKGKHRLTW